MYSFFGAGRKAETPAFCRFRASNVRKRTFCEIVRIPRSTSSQRSHSRLPRSSAPIVCPDRLGRLGRSEPFPPFLPSPYSSSSSPRFQAPPVARPCVVRWSRKTWALEASRPALSDARGRSESVVDRQSGVTLAEGGLVRRVYLRCWFAKASRLTRRRLAQDVGPDRWSADGVLPSLEPSRAAPRMASPVDGPTRNIQRKEGGGADEEIKRGREKKEGRGEKKRAPAHPAILSARGIAPPPPSGGGAGRDSGSWRRSAPAWESARGGDDRRARS